MNNKKKIKSKILFHAKNILLPIFVSLYFLTFHYANNVTKVTFSKSIIIALPFIGLSIVAFYIFYYFSPQKPNYASLSAFVFVLSSLFYGIVYDWLLVLDIITLEHYSFLPLYILSMIYISSLIFFFSRKLVDGLQKTFTVVILGLIAFNLVRIIPVEIQKSQINNKSQSYTTAVSANPTEENYPDIYYIILDEAAGFDVIRDYFEYPDIDKFVKFLTDHGFFVAEKSRTNELHTLRIMSERLNYHDFPEWEDSSITDYFIAITDNLAQKYLKNKGYSTVAFPELGEIFSYPNMPEMNVDYLYVVEEVDNLNTNFSNDFVQMVLNQTIFRVAFIGKNKDLANEQVARHVNMIDYTAEKIGDLQEVPPPRFVYAHLIFPHKPYIYDENGVILDLRHHKNWDYYLGQYNYAMKIAEKMITSILDNSDPERPPIIILQSDHGARNILNKDIDFKPLENYPKEYAYHIINTIYNPYCDDSQLAQDMDPINTFPIIFNCIFNDNIPMK